MANFIMKIKGDFEWTEIQAADLDAAWDIAADTYKDEPEGTEILVMEAL